MEKIDKKLSRLAVEKRGTIPYTTDENGKAEDWAKKDVGWWTNGFWPGMMWLMYDATKNEEYKLTAENAEEILDKAFEFYDKINHDVGFMWHLSAGANYRLTGNEKSRIRDLYAANLLAGRYNIRGGFVKAWNGDDHIGDSIIDCMMNIPLLYWASAEIGDERFKKIAMRHADMTLRDHVREDGSVHHIVCHHTEREEVLCVKAGQGYQEGSSWSRGVAWGLYGFTLSYLHTKEERYLHTAMKIADYFSACAEETQWLPRFDFRQPAEPLYYDSTAGAIAACGLIELAKALEGEKSDAYLNVAIQILKAMETAWCNWDENEDSILQMGSEMYTNGIHKPIIYGDYFFTEAILKLKGSTFLAW